MPIVIWPRDLLRPENFSMRPVNTSTSGGRAPHAGEQVVQGAGGYWRATLDKVGLSSPERVRAYRAIMAALDGRAGLCMVPVWDALQQPAPYSVEVPWAEAGVPWGEGSVPWSSGTTDVFVNAPALVRATSIEVRWGATPPEAGQYFAVGQSFHIIARTSPLTETTASVTFRPPARTAFAQDDEVNMSDPRCLMRLLTDEEGELMLRPGGFGTPSLTFVEANVPLPYIPTDA
jgi:hypothetical protein